MYSWTQLGRALTNNSARVIYSFPVAGYVVLYSDYFQRLFKFDSLAPSVGFLTVFMRANLIYFGSLVLGGAFLVWIIFSPGRLRGKRDLQHFVADVVAARDTAAVRAILMEEPFTLPAAKVAPLLSDYETNWARVSNRTQSVGDGAGDYERLIPAVLGNYFEWQNSTRPFARTLVAVLAAAGYFLILIPAGELLFRVLSANYYRIFV